MEEGKGRREEEADCRNDVLKKRLALTCSCQKRGKGTRAPHRLSRRGQLKRRRSKKLNTLERMAFGGRPEKKKASRRTITIASSEKKEKGRRHQTSRIEDKPRGSVTPQFTGQRKGRMMSSF